MLRGASQPLFKFFAFLSDISHPRGKTCNHSLRKQRIGWAACGRDAGGKGEEGGWKETRTVEHPGLGFASNLSDLWEDFDHLEVPDQRPDVGDVFCLLFGSLVR